MNRDSEQPTALVMMVPVKEGHEEALLATLAAMATGAQSPFALLQSTHFARWLVIGALLDGNGEPAEPEQAYLLFTCDFDGSLESWAQAAASQIGPTLDRVFDHCLGYRGSGDAGTLLRFIGEHRVDVGFSIISYRATVSAIRESLALRHELRVFAAASDGLSAGELHSAWQQRFGR